MKFQRSLYVLKDTAKILPDFIKKEFVAAGMKEMNIVPRVFAGNSATAKGYEDDLLVLAAVKCKIEEVKVRLCKDLV